MIYRHEELVSASNTEVIDRARPPLPIAVVSVLTAGIVGLLIGWWGIVAAVIVVGIAFVLLLIFVSSLIPWLMLALVFFGNRTELAQLELLGRWLPTIGIVLLLVALPLRLATKSHSQPIDPALRRALVSIFWTIVAFGAVITVSALANGSSMRDVIVGLGVNLRYPIFFLALVLSRFDSVQYRRMIKVWIALTVLQIPIALFQYFGLGLSGDLLTGTMGSNQPLLMALLILEAFLFSSLLISGFRMSYAIVLGIVPLLFIMADVQAGLFLLPLLLLFLTLRSKQRPSLPYVRHRVHVLLIFAGFALVSLSAMGILYLQKPEVFDRLQSITMIPELTDTRYIATSSVGRLTIVPFTLGNLREQPLQLLLGFGPEATYGGLLGGDQGRACEYFVEQGLTRCRTTQIFRTLGEFGILGGALVLAILIQVWRLNRSLLNLGTTTSALIVALTFESIAVLYTVLMPIYDDIWRVDIYGFAFYLWAAAIVAERRATLVEPLDGQRQTDAATVLRVGDAPG